MQRKLEPETPAASIRPLDAKSRELRNRALAEWERLQWYIRDIHDGRVPAIGRYFEMPARDDRTPDEIMVDAYWAYYRYEMRGCPGFELPFSLQDIINSYPAVKRVAQRRAIREEYKRRMDALVQGNSAEGAAE